MPLSRLKVLDFSTLLPGPWASMILADLGADVVRVEAPQRPDILRRHRHGEVWHAQLNRSKRSITLDLKQPAAVDVVKRLIVRHDIVLEQFRPGVMDRLGTGFDALSAVNPQLIYCAITGYGQTGPYQQRAGHDINYLSLAGMMAHAGRKAHGPTPLPVQVADVGGGSFGAVIGILAAVIERQASGQGQFVDISMLDSAVAWNALAIGQYLVSGQEPQAEGEWLNGGTYYDFYATADGRYLSLGALEPKFWAAFCRAIGREDLIDKADANQTRLKAEIQATLGARTQAEWMETFAGTEACVEPVLSIAETLEHPQVKARGLVVGGKGGEVKQVASPYKFSRSQTRFGPAPEPGADSDEILQDNGYNPTQIAELRRQGALG